MAYAIVHHFPGGTKEQYEVALAAVRAPPITLHSDQGSTESQR